MSDTAPRRYQPTVEDDSDEAQAATPSIRTTANVAVKRNLNSESYFDAVPIQYKHDGTDSGYASKAPTVSSMTSSQRRRGSDLKINTAVVTERERTPYAQSAAPRNAEHQVQPKEREPLTAAPKPVKKPFCHKEGICWVCDRYGFHFDPKDPPKDLQKKVVVKPATPAPQPQQTAKPAAPKPKGEEAIASRPAAPRRSSQIQARPTSMYATTPLQTPYAQYPAMHHGWSMAPPTPNIAYAAYPMMTPTTPLAYMAPQQFYYEPQPVFDDPPSQAPKATRRLSQATSERPVLEKKPSLTRTSTLQGGVATPLQRPPLVSHDSKKSLDADKVAMPPPPKPQHALSVNAARPRPGRSNTYNTVISANRRSTYEESSESENDDYLNPEALVTYTKPPASPRRPPSSYKAPTLEGVAERPSMPKSKSYHDGANTLHVAAMPRRRTTESMPTNASHEKHKEAAAEAYMRKRTSMPLVDLTAENLVKLKNAVPRHLSDQRSESGSTASYATHHSSSKDSASGGRGRAPTSIGSGLGHAKGTSMSINVNGMNLTITDDGNTRGDAPPVKLDLGGIQINMNNRDKENIDIRPKSSQKQLERNPSVSSRPSRRSLTSASLASAAAEGQRREKDHILPLEAGQRDYVRRESFVTDDERELSRRPSARSSRQPSRNPSSVRQPLDGELPVRPRAASKRGSVDYSQLRKDEVVM